MQTTVYYAITLKFKQFWYNYSHFLLRKLRNFQKGVPLTSKISMLEIIFSKIPSQLELDSKRLFWVTAREVLFEHLMHESDCFNGTKFRIIYMFRWLFSKHHATLLSRNFYIYFWIVNKLNSTRTRKCMLISDKAIVR